MTTRPVTFTVATAILTATLGAALAAPAGATPTPHHKKPAVKFATSGHAYGSLLQVGTLAGSGESALTSVGCSATHVTRRKATAQVRLSTLGQVGAVRTHTTTGRSVHGAVRTVSHARTAHISLLDGLIRVRALWASAVARGRKHSVTTGHSSLLGLRIAGHLMAANPKPNTTLRIPGLATLTLNAQRRTFINGVKRIKVDALRLKLLHGSKFGALGTTLSIGHATAAVHKIVSTSLRGKASGSTISVAGLALSSPTFRTRMPCANGNVQRGHNGGAGINLGALLKTGVIHTWALGKSGAAPKSTTRSKISKVKLLGGLVTVRVLQAQANVTNTLGHLRRSNAGSKVVGLRIGGKPMNLKLTPNTKINLLGIGTLWLDRVIKTRRTVTVHMVSLVLGHRVDGLRRGAVINVANAMAGIRAGH